MATVYGIVRQSEGRISVHSTPRVGTRFVIDFPVIVSEPPETDEKKTGFTVCKGTETMLLAEDEESVRKFAVAVLVSAGDHVIQGINGEDALALGLSYDGSVDLVFTDAVMPRLGGRGFVEKITNVRPNIKVLYTSGYDDNAIMQHRILAGKAAFLQKPYTAIKMLQKIREVLDHKSYFSE